MTTSIKEILNRATKTLFDDRPMNTNSNDFSVSRDIVQKVKHTEDAIVIEETTIIRIPLNWHYNSANESMQTRKEIII